MPTYKNTVLVTGGTIGLGYQAALQIAKQHPDYLVVIASRKNTNSAAAKINEATGQQNAVFQSLDLSSLENIRAFCEEYSKKGYSPLKALLLNAALQFPDKLEYSTDGIEKTFAITHVGHALLFYLLRSSLTPDARIVITASGVHDPEQLSGMPRANYVTAEELAHLSPEGTKADGRLHYVHAKLANILWTYALHRRLERESKPERTWTVTAFDPGLLPGTGLAREYPAFLRFLWFYVLPYTLPLLRRFVSPNIHTAQESGKNLARLAVGEDVRGVSGRYFEGHKEIKSSVDSYSEDKQENLYEWTIDAVAKNEEEKRSFRDV